MEIKMVFPIKTCVIIRGLSGSGKSTLAKKIQKNHSNHSTSIHETDKFFYNEDGEYKIDFSKMAEYHQKNFEEFSESIENNTWVVINSNTNTQLWEFDHYVNKALEHGYSIMILDLYDAGLTNKELHKRQKHDFPIEKYDVVRSHYERSYANLDPRKPWERGEK
jgi:uridine kinase